MDRCIPCPSRYMLRVEGSGGAVAQLCDERPTSIAASSLLIILASSQSSIFVLQPLPPFKALHTVTSASRKCQVL